MAEYERSIIINADPQTIFDFVSDVRNLPRYLPTTHNAEPQGEGRVRVQGEAEGHAYDSDGKFRADPENFSLQWGSDGERQYKGWLEIDGDDGGSQVTVHLTFGQEGDGDSPVDQQAGVSKVNEGIEASLKSIKNIVEGMGSKVEPSAAT